MRNFLVTIVFLTTLLNANTVEKLDINKTKTEIMGLTQMFISKTFANPKAVTQTFDVNSGIVNLSSTYNCTKKMMFIPINLPINAKTEIKAKDGKTMIEVSSYMTGEYSGRPVSEYKFMDDNVRNCIESNEKDIINKYFETLKAGTDW
jgi:hypothetical protein